MRIEYTPTDLEKTHALGAVYYEIQQFCRCVELQLLLWMQPSTDQAIKNAYLESMLVHVCVLKDFFEGPRTSDNVLSSDFGFSTAPLGLPEEYETRINKELVHLTYSRAKRLTIEQKRWKFVLLLPLIDRSIEFIDSRSKEELDRLVEFRGRHGIVPLSWMNLKQALVALRLWARQQSSTTVSTTSSSSCLEVQEAV